MLEAKVTALTADPSNDAVRLTVQVYDDATPAVIIWEGPITVQTDWAPERVSDTLDAVLERVERRREAIARLQTLVGRTRRRR